MIIGGNQTMYDAYDALKIATSIVLIKIEFMTMIIKFISSLFSKDIIKITFNAISLLIFDFCCFLIFNINSVDDFFLFTMLLSMYYFLLVSITVDNNNIKLQKKLKKNNQEDFTHIPIGKTIKTKNIIHTERKHEKSNNLR